jgi:hypothetical protein
MPLRPTAIVNLGLVLLLAFSTATATYAAAAGAGCSVSCDNGSCSGTGTCSCIAGNPYCTSASSQISSYSVYLRSWDLGGLTAVADAADGMNEALKAKNFPAFYEASVAHDEAISKLSDEERDIYQKWSF